MSYSGAEHEMIDCRFDGLIRASRQECRLTVPVSIAGFDIDFHTNCRSMYDTLQSYLPYFITDRCRTAVSSAYFFRCADSLIQDSIVPYAMDMSRVAGTFVPFPEGTGDDEFFQVYTQGPSLFLRRGMRHPSLWLAFDLAGMNAVVLAGAGIAAGQWAFRQCFLVLFHEMMKRKGFYPLHAAAVSSGGRALLLAASPGRGKTTMALAMVRRGFSFLSDDTIFLRPPGDGPDMVPFPEAVKVLPSMLSFFEELDFLKERALPEGVDKYTFRIEDIYGSLPCGSSRPSCIVFLERSPRDDTVCEPLPPRDALKKLVSQMSLPHAQKSLVKDYFSLVTELVKKVPSCILTTGNEPGQGAVILEELMERL